MSDKLYDPKCYELAAYFLEGASLGKYPEERIGDLAYVIQSAIEDWCEETGMDISGERSS
jgi:hypothetical protein